MAEDFYSDSADPEVAAPEAPEGDVETEENDKPDGEDAEGETALINDSFFPPECKVGDTYTIKVVGQHDGEKSIVLKKGEKKEAEETEEEPSIKDKIQRRAMMG